jgi:hypothetical protein
MYFYNVGEIVKINKWSPSLYPYEVYDPVNTIFPKQHRLFGEYCFLGIVLGISEDMCEVWVLNLEKTYYIFNKDIEKCQD